MKRESRAWALGPILALATAAVFWPILRLGFLEIDDNLLITANPYVQRGLTWANVRWAFTTTYDALWHPMTWLSHMLDCQFFGLQPWGHHLTALPLHAAAAWLLYALLYKGTVRAWESAAAALFAFHPLRVESVAWAAEREVQLCVFFFLGALLAYARYADAHNDLGFLYLEQGRSEMAKREFLLKLQPGHPQAAANLARLEARR